MHGREFAMRSISISPSEQRVNCVGMAVHAVKRGERLPIVVLAVMMLVTVAIVISSFGGGGD
jgi:hypothetical protein